MEGGQSTSRTRGFRLTHPPPPVVLAPCIGGGESTEGEIVAGAPEATEVAVEAPEGIEVVAVPAPGPALAPGIVAISTPLPR